MLQNAIDGIKALNLPKGTEQQWLIRGSLAANAIRGGLEEFYKLSGISKDELNIVITEIPEPDYYAKAMAEAGDDHGHRTRSGYHVQVPCQGAQPQRGRDALVPARGLLLPRHAERLPDHVRRH